VLEVCSAAAVLAVVEVIYTSALGYGVLVVVGEATAHTAAVVAVAPAFATAALLYMHYSSATVEQE
jgi:hypothetical protein